MSHFYGTINNGKNIERTMRGFKPNGLTVEAQSWQGKIKVELSVDEYGNDTYDVYRENHGNSTIIRELVARGRFNDYKRVNNNIKDGKYDVITSQHNYRHDQNGNYKRSTDKSNYNEH